MELISYNAIMELKSEVINCESKNRQTNCFKKRA
nr:MAG TPA: hypothetical protein [Caudoviricetes sp.]